MYYMIRRYVKKSYKKRAPKKTSVVALSKAVSKIKRKLAQTYETMFLQNRGIVFPVQDYTSINVMNYNNCRSIFGTSGNDYAVCNKWRHKSTKMDFLITLGDETTNIDYSFFLVSIKDSASASYDKSTGAIVLTEGLHYAVNENVTPDNPGQTFINPKVFNIHKMKRFTIGNNNEPVGTSTATGPTSLKRFGWKLKIDKIISNPIGNVSALNVSQDPSSQYYVLLFNNNVAADSEENNVQFNMVHTIEVPN